MTYNKLKKYLPTNPLVVGQCFRTQFRHWRTGKLIRAADYGHRAFRFSRSRSSRK